MTGMSVVGSTLVRTATGDSWTDAFAYATNPLSAAGSYRRHSSDDGTLYYAPVHACVHADHQACVYLSPTSFHLLMSPVRLADEFAALVPSCFLYLTNLCSRQQTICITAGLPLAWVAAGVVGLRVQVFGLRAQFIGLSDGSEGSRNPILSRYGVRTNTFGQVIIPR